MRPIRKLFLRELMALLGLLVLVLIALVWFGMRGTLERQIDARTQESIFRLERDLHSYLQEAERVGRSAGHWVEDGRLPLDQPRVTDSLLRPLLAESPSVESVTLIGADGVGSVVLRRNGILDSYGFRATAEGVYRTPCRVGGALVESPHTDYSAMRFLDRPWLQTARTSMLPQWVSVYSFLANPVQGLSFVVPILDDQGAFKAAICVDILMNTLSQRVWETRPTPQAQALVCDSRMMVQVAPKGAGAAAAPLGEGNSPLFHQLVRRWTEASHSSALVRFPSGGQTFVGRVLPLRGSRGADWLVCLAVPESDFQRGLKGFAATILGVGLAFLGILAWRLHRLSTWVSTPLASLARAAEALGKGTTPVPPDSRILEIDALGQAFQKAGQALERDAELQLKFQHSQRLETVGTLAGGIAHDVNNQLAAIIGQLNLGQEQLGPDHPVAARIRKAEEAAQRCGQMIKSLLGFSHQTRPVLERLDLNELVRSTGSLVERLLGGCIRLDLALAPDLDFVRGDRVSLEQVLMNLAVNARDAMPQGGRLLVSTQATSSREVCLSVHDTGTGIPEEILPKIFDPFFTTKEVGKGTGLGLAMVFGIVQAHQGRIEVESEPGKGTVFRIFLAAYSTGQASAEPRDPTRDLDEFTLAGRRILVVEDEAPLRDLLAEAFTNRRAQVDTARDGAEGWALWQGAHYDLMVSDQRMPELTGLELLARIRATGSTVPVILASGHGLENAEAELARDPRLRILPKPFSLKRIFTLAGELLEGAVEPTSGR